MSERVNPKYVKAWRADQSIGTPLFDSALDRVAPPEVVKASAARQDSFKKHVTSGNMAKSRERVFNIIKKFGPITIQDMKKYGIEINIASGRTSELVEEGKVVVCGEKYNAETRRNRTLYQAKADA